MLIKYIKSVLWRVAKCLSYIEEARCLKVKSSARSNTVNNTARYCNLTILLLAFIYICSLELFIFSRSIEFMYRMNCFRFLLVSSLLLTGQLPTLSTLFFRIYLSFFSLKNYRKSRVPMQTLHTNGRPFVVCLYMYKRNKDKILRPHTHTHTLPTAIDL